MNLLAVLLAGGDIPGLMPLFQNSPKQGAPLALVKDGDVILAYTLTPNAVRRLRESGVRNGRRFPSSILAALVRSGDAHSPRQADAAGQAFLFTEEDIDGRSGEDGVAVLMRYTLRLLTLQQFQRAATLICACEVLRRDTPKTWGKTPFRLGLWVGRKTTPNTVAQSAEAISQIRSGGYVSGYIGSPAQLQRAHRPGRRRQDPRSFSGEAIGPTRRFLQSGAWRADRGPPRRPGRLTTAERTGRQRLPFMLNPFSHRLTPIS